MCIHIYLVSSYLKLVMFPPSYAYDKINYVMHFLQFYVITHSKVATYIITSTTAVYITLTLIFHPVTNWSTSINNSQALESSCTKV